MNGCVIDRQGHREDVLLDAISRCVYLELELDDRRRTRRASHFILFYFCCCSLSRHIQYTYIYCRFKRTRSREALEDAPEAVEGEDVHLASGKTQRVLSDALDRIGQRFPGVELFSVRMPSYPGLFSLWDYARDMRKTLLMSLDVAVKQAEDEARVITTAGVQ